ncbi:MAG: heavy metal-associated domain-containing protein [Vicinamibacterales bacterium]
MTCAAGAVRIGKNLNKLPGVVASVNFASEVARVTFEPGLTSAPAVFEAVAAVATPHLSRRRIS